ncbi:unnamed protein product [Brassicogethes aeneus]|uniref:Protein kinase domain-containing protein n=1 Tax=Brassicogethes aeneus TaxID=1431903 RepID=A0A9P0B4K8_BRAAE|nr:unnamed protein product [Brassicogethes aeneus]
MAPEVIERRQYGKAVDIWAAGVLLHVLLSGTLPFHGSGRRLMDAICRGKLHLDTSPQWEFISDNAKDLVSQMLSVDPKQRITIQEILNHRWLRVTVATIIDSLDDIYCLQESQPQEYSHLLQLLEDTHLHVLLKLFDRIGSKVAAPVRAPPSDAVQCARDAADALRELENRRDTDHRDLQELRDLLCRPHFKVSLFRIAVRNSIQRHRVGVVNRAKKANVVAHSFAFEDI